MNSYFVNINPLRLRVAQEVECELNGVMTKGVFIPYNGNIEKGTDRQPELNFFMAYNPFKSTKSGTSYFDVMQNIPQSEYAELKKKGLTTKPIKVGFATTARIKASRTNINDVLK